MSNRRSTSVALVRRHRHELSERVALLHALQPGQHVLCGASRRRACWPPAGPACQPACSASTLASSSVNLPASTMNSTTSTSPSTEVTVRLRLRLSAVRPRMSLVWKPGVSTKTNCVAAQRADAGDAVARGLRLARGDADLLPHQRVQQRGLAHVGAADDGDQATAGGGVGARGVGARGGCVGDVSSSRCRVSCAMGRRACRWPSGG